MARMVAAASPMRPYQEYTTQDPTTPTDLDHWQTAMPAMPPTPPPSFNYPPHHTGGLHRPHHDLLQSLQNDCNITSAGSYYGDGMMDVMADDAQLFEHALMAMRGDQQSYLIEETESRNLEIRTKSKDHSAIQKTPPSKKRPSRANGARTKKIVAVRPPPRPSLAATHPALYTKTPATPKPQPQTMLPTPPPEVHNDFKSQPVQKPSPPPPAYRLSVLPWKLYTDPNRLLSAEPQFDDPMYRMLKMDVNPDQPSVVSPLFMIGMPCGSLIEAANYYGDDEMEA